jgi:hypothetical protein
MFELPIDEKIKKNKNALIHHIEEKSIKKEHEKEKIKKEKKSPIIEKKIEKKEQNEIKISALKKKNAALKKKNEDFDTILLGVDNFVIIKNQNIKIEKINFDFFIPLFLHIIKKTIELKKKLKIKKNLT